MWLKLRKFLAFPVLLFKRWKLKKERKKRDKITEDVSKVVEINEPTFEHIEKLSESIKNEISLTHLENQIEAISKVKNELTKKERNKYNNQLDQLLMRANARLRKLQGLTFEELDLERLIIEQRRLLSKQQNTKIRRESIDFAKIRSYENIINGVDLNRLNLYPEKQVPPVPVEIENQLSDLLADLFIDKSLDTNEKLTVEEFVQEIDEPFLSETLPNEEGDIEEVISYLKSNGVSHFYHVTNIKNIQSIEKNGLYSWKRLDELRLTYHNNVVDEISRQRDVFKGKQNYVRLSFCKATPMFYAKKSMQTNVIYWISIECLRECKFEFSDMNATDNFVKIGSSFSFIKSSIRFNLFNRYYPQLEGMDRKYFQAELLINEHIPSKFIFSKEAF